MANRSKIWRIVVLVKCHLEKSRISAKCLTWSKVVSASAWWSAAVLMSSSFQSLVEVLKTSLESSAPRFKKSISVMLPIQNKNELFGRKIAEKLFCLALSQTIYRKPETTSVKWMNLKTKNQGLMGCSRRKTELTLKLVITHREKCAAWKSR